MVEDALTQPKADGCITLMVHNMSLSPVHLTEGEVLGGVHPVTVLSDLKAPDAPTEDVQPGAVRKLNPFCPPADDQVSNGSLCSGG